MIIDTFYIVLGQLVVIIAIIIVILFIIVFISADKFLLSLFEALGTFDIISEAEFSLWEFFI